MDASGAFTVETFTPIDLPREETPTTATPVGLARMEKHFTGEVSGHSTTLFTFAVDHSTDVGGYVAMESFAGKLHERTGTFNFTHSATTTGEDRDHESFVIIPSSGTGDLAGITGTGGLRNEADGTHRVWLTYELPE